MPKKIEKTEKKEKEKTAEIKEEKSEKKKLERKSKTPKTLKENKTNKDKEKPIDKKSQKINKDKIEKSEEEKSETKKISSEDKSSLSEDKSSKDKKSEEKKEEPKIEKRKERKERIGVLNIYTTFNNTIMNLTDLSGKSIAKFGGGQSTKQDRLKANPTIAMFVSQRIAEEARDNGITGFYVKIRAKTGQNNPGPGAHAAIKSLTRAGFRILSIMDTTRVPRGGPKKKGGRRGRRP